mmetsp:Transcript_34582/g.69862  ORF Transcript_34582/g.69862 Transcript_34582/m.69862 type:complete len:355 (-) Transcript_34582:1595-2659(-)
MPGSINDLNKGLGFGLNARGSGSSAGPPKKKKRKTAAAGTIKKKASVFDDASSDDSSGDDHQPSSSGGGGGTTGRSLVNAEIAQEQAALRRRAEAAMTAAKATSADVYNYDEGYEQFSTAEREAKRKAAAAASSQSQPERKSRYIGQLLKTAETRKREHDILHERRVAREQAAEEATNAVEFAGKEKFVTKSYKRKLAEREAWLKEEEVKEKEEEAAERGRREGQGGIGMASFLSNVVRGDDDSVDVTGVTAGERKEDTDLAGGFTDGFSRDGEGKLFHEEGDYANTKNDYRPKLAAARAQYSDDTTEVAAKPTKEEEEAAVRRKRNGMIVAARERYLERKRTGQVAALFGAVQ